MAGIKNINNHIAWVCECGCVRFNLLRSGLIECDNCRLTQNGNHTVGQKNTRIKNIKHLIEKWTKEDIGWTYEKY